MAGSYLKARTPWPRVGIVAPGSGGSGRARHGRRRGVAEGQDGAEVERERCDIPAERGQQRRDQAGTLVLLAVDVGRVVVDDRREQRGGPVVGDEAAGAGRYGEPRGQRHAGRGGRATAGHRWTGAGRRERATPYGCGVGPLAVLLFGGVRSPAAVGP